MAWLCHMASGSGEDLAFPGRLCTLATAFRGCHSRLEQTLATRVVIGGVANEGLGVFSVLDLYPPRVDDETGPQTGSVKTRGTHATMWASHTTKLDVASPDGGAPRPFLGPSVNSFGLTKPPLPLIHLARTMSHEPISTLTFIMGMVEGEQRTSSLRIGISPLQSRLRGCCSMLCGSFPSSGWTNALLLGATVGDRQKSCGVANDLHYHGSSSSLVLFRLLQSIARHRAPKAVSLI